MGRQNKASLYKVYRLTLIDDRTHERISSWHISKLRLILYGVTALVVIVLGMYSIIAFTPIRTTIPGYPDFHSKRDAMANAIKIDSLESIISRWELYSENLSRVLSGTQTLSLDSLLAGSTTKYLSNKSAEELARRDSAMRDLLHDEEQFELSGKQKSNLPIEGLHFFTPIKGVVCQSFDMVQHPAIDIKAPAGTVVMSILEGTVIFEEWNDANGYTIQIQHSGDLISIYQHNQKLLKKVGDKVSGGAPIALSGSAMKSIVEDGDQLHFALWHKGEAIDPQKYIKF